MVRILPDASRDTVTGIFETWLSFNWTLAGIAVARLMGSVNSTWISVFTGTPVALLTGVVSNTAGGMVLVFCTVKPLGTESVCVPVATCTVCAPKVAPEGIVS